MMENVFGVDVSKSWIGVAGPEGHERVFNAQLAGFARRVAGAFLISFTMHAGWALVLSSRPVRAAYAGGRRWVEAGLGSFFAFAAFKMATAR